MTYHSWRGVAPRVVPSAFVAETAALIGDVEIGAQASIWFGAVLRADNAAIVIGARTNLQDGVIAHVDPGFPVRVGVECTIGHGAILHGCVIGDGTLVGMGARILNGAVIGQGSLVAAGAVIPEGRSFESGVVLAGIPARVVRSLTPADRERLRIGSSHYVQLAREWPDAARIVEV